MFKKILIANRGEIACRIIKTARKMGIKTVAVCSEADRDAMHVEMADEFVMIGPAPSALSYLNMDRIIEACKETGAEAVHPGYGFLSERAEFPELLKQAGITFIGPSARAISALGDKIESKRLAAAAGVSTVPGFMGVIESPQHAITIAEEIGYPVMIKASAGGGGKGIRIVNGPEEMAENFKLARSEAANSFADDRIFVEKYITNPRHIEIQILGDKHGNIIHLGERECSIQRRNQKVIEEAPSVLLDEETRQKMADQAIALAKAVDYDSAGTVEFVAGQDKSFYFLEMNTRLQVEHPVTEMITGVDLVEQMIRIAYGEKLSYAQSDIHFKGWAIESRIYAEDPTRNFLPSTGRLTIYREPESDVNADGVTVRTDSGVEEGGEISVYYDPMIAKLITHAPTRLEAIQAQRQALDSLAIEGVRPNIAFLAALMNHPRWLSGELSTNLLAEEFPEGYKPALPEGDMARQFIAIAVAAEHVHNQRKREVSKSIRPAGALKVEQNRVAILGKQSYSVKVEERQQTLLISIDGEPVRVISAWQPGNPVWAGHIDRDVVFAQIRPVLNGSRVMHGGCSADIVIYRASAAKLMRFMPERQDNTSSKQVVCPMPGLVKSVFVTEGVEVKQGDPLCIVEAMKMENILRSERDGTIAKIFAREGDSLAVDAEILEFTA
ncbi:acetyl/propionyl/methylcrotonyl-CoA carboxylase subunit alpha [Microvirga sp. W0021]|uniref:propionyl-CoA carboxylase n=1 Tax=Hohaiivirga grylli TaxID=3133970 RepID=A0ABV0BJ12_9HYPH